MLSPAGSVRARLLGATGAQVTSAPFRSFLIHAKKDSPERDCLSMVAGEIFIEYANEAFPFLLGRKGTFDREGVYLSVI